MKSSSSNWVVEVEVGVDVGLLKLKLESTLGCCCLRSSAEYKVLVVYVVADIIHGHTLHAFLNEDYLFTARIENNSNQSD